MSNLAISDETLKSLIGQNITVQSRHHDDPDKAQLDFSLNGELETPVDDDPNFHLRVKDCYNGISGISFNAKHVYEIYRQVSGRIQITLKAV